MYKRYNCPLFGGKELVLENVGPSSRIYPIFISLPGLCEFHSIAWLFDWYELVFYV